MLGFKKSNEQILRHLAKNTFIDIKKLLLNLFFSTDVEWIQGKIMEKLLFTLNEYFDEDYENWLSNEFQVNELAKYAF